MEKKEDYEKLYDMLLGYEQEIHKKNQKRIRIGLRCLIIIPLIFLALLFWTESSKIVFLILWIVSLFLLAAYLGVPVLGVAALGLILVLTKFDFNLSTLKTSAAETGEVAQNDDDF